MTFRWLIRLGEWLDKRFPAKVVITRAELDERDERVKNLEQSVSFLDGNNAAFSERVSALEKSVAAIKDAITRGQIAPRTDKEALREKFIRGEFPPHVSREAVEDNG